jgi:hypothetical protein
MNPLYTLIGVKSDITLDANASVRIPNTEIQSEFRGWIRQDFHSRMTPELSETSVGQFNLPSLGIRFPDLAAKSKHHGGAVDLDTMDSGVCGTPLSGWFHVLNIKTPTLADCRSGHTASPSG